MEHEAGTEDEEPALVTLRYTSQVCSAWRKIAIGSPSLWARVVNLNYLCQNQDEWRKEVMCRTGTALLHIKSIMFSKWTLAPDPVEWILTENWTRIRSLDIHLMQKFTPNAHRWRCLFQRPAPSLEVFKFSWLSPRGVYLTTPDFVLFSNTAPSLRTLSVSDMTLDLAAFSVSYLRVLVQHLSVSAFDLLRALSHMPLLETLEAMGTQPLQRDENTDSELLPQVTLPRLTTIKFYTGSCADLALLILTHINPAIRCTLDFYGRYRHESPHDNSINRCGIVFSKYFGHCPDVEGATNLKITFKVRFILFSVNVSNHGKFTFSADCLQPHFPPTTISTLFSSITVMRLDTIRKLELYLDYIDRDQAYSRAAITRFFLRLVSVEELDTDPSTLKLLHDIQIDTAAVTIPYLKDIRLPNMIREPEQLWLADFFNARIDQGIPVDTYILMISYARFDIELLRKSVPGLTVKIVDNLWRNVS